MFCVGWDASAACLWSVLRRPSRRPAPPKLSLGPWPIASKGPCRRGGDVKPSRRDVCKTRTHFGRHFLSSISRCVHAHTCLSELETACRSAHIPQHQRAALFRRKTLSARRNSQLRQRASHSFAIKRWPKKRNPAPATTCNRKNGGLKIKHRSSPPAPKSNIAALLRPRLHSDLTPSTRRPRRSPSST